MKIVCIIFACIATNKGELEVNFTSSCNTSLKIIHETKFDVRLRDRLKLAPEISCLVCSSSNCKNDTSCKGKSAIEEIPLYNNLLEFGFIKNFIPMETITIIKISENCSFKLNISQTTDPNVFGLNFFECPNGEECLESINGFKIKITMENKCIHIGLIFLEEKKVYFTVSTSCYYVPTVYFDKHKNLEIFNNKCNFNPERDKPSASFQFSLGSSYQFDVAPLVLPCSPGGYVVNHASGLFYEGSKCEKYFNDPKFVYKDTGLPFVISLVYSGDENLSFPVIESYRRTTYPLYYFENGSVAFREEMASKIIKNPKAINKIRRNCNLEDAIEGFPNCDEEIFASNHENRWIKEPNYQNYVPRYSCLLCAQPSCDFKKLSCEKWATTEYLPVYNDFIEFGLYGLNFPILSDINIILNEDCYLKIQITPIKDLDHVSIFISECLFEDKNCIVNNYTLNGNFSFHKDCLFVTLGFFENMYIYFEYSVTCTTVSTSKLFNKSYVTIIQDSCHFNSSEHHFLIQYRFLQDKYRLTDGVPLILPCSPGGYAVDPFTGRFLTNQSCDSLFWSSALLNDTGIKFIIKKFYEDNENLLFPVAYRNESTNKSRLLPIFIDENLEGKPFDEMKPKDVKFIDQNHTGRYRTGCYFNESNDAVEIPKSFEYEEKLFRREMEENNTLEFEKSAGFSFQNILETTEQHVIKMVIYTALIGFEYFLETLC